MQLYKSIKQIFKLKFTLKWTFQNIEDLFLAQFRYEIFPIRIETGLYKGESLEEKICHFCVLNEIEDESHFLLNCAVYSNFRRELFNNVGYNPTVVMSNLDCIIFLLSNFPRQTSKYLLECYLYRQSLLYKKAIRNICICYNCICSDI